MSGLMRSPFGAMLVGVIAAAGAAVLAPGIQTAEYFGLAQVIGLPVCLVLSMAGLVRSLRGGKWYIAAAMPIAAVDGAICVLAFWR